MFWKRWKREYLLELREAHRYHRGAVNAAQIKVGDVVVVHTSDQPRAFWRLGRVTKLVKGNDDRVRGAVLKVSGEGRQATMLERPIQLLYPLETSEVEPCSDQHGTPDKKTLPEEEPQRCDRPRRAAAQVARDRILAETLIDS